MTRINGHEIDIDNRDKALFPGEAITKGDVIDYYREIAEYILPHIEGRPLTLQRFPDGLDEDGFYQQQVPEHFPDWIDTRSLPRADGSERIDHILCNDTASLVYLANLATITIHRWLARAPRFTRPDCLIFDLDPAGEDFTPVRDAARQVVELMQTLEVMPFVMTTGSRGLHVIAPLAPELDFDAVREIATGMAGHLAARHPETLTTEQRKDKRRGRLYLDVMRNAYGQTGVAPYSLRAHPGAPVATPLSIDELDRGDLGPQDYHIGNIFRRLGQTGDPWADIRRHAVDPRGLRDRLEALRKDDG
ncbi:non-homologous end-joining DNA ligase [Guyparkeria sp.]|uniref:non-homologous end-joining DNA ligase n=1 Tax=Guyparkeria sp. TaxID=2035736 RepID=UPI003561D872